MKVLEFVESLEVDPSEEFLSQFKLIKEYRKHLQPDDRETCLSCGKKYVMMIPSTSWTELQFCSTCMGLNLIIHVDMGTEGGEYISCYVDKE